ncbi:MAG: hypothetical protein WAO07_13635 [Desulfobacterales bacterium]
MKPPPNSISPLAPEVFSNPAHLRNDSHNGIFEWATEQRKDFEDAKRCWGDPLSYEQNWLYVSQACRNGGWVYKSPKGWIVVAKNYLFNERHAAIVPLADDLTSFISAAMTEFGSEGIRPAILKHLPIQAIEKALASGHFKKQKPARNGSNTSMEALSEDHFPQIIAHVGRLNWVGESEELSNVLPSLPGGPAFRKFRNHVRRFARACYSNSVEINLTSVLEAPERKIREVVNGWLESLKYRFSRIPQPHVHDFDACFRKPTEAVIRSARSDEKSVGTLISVGDRPSALWIVSRISTSCNGIYTMIANTKFKNLGDYMLYLILHTVKQLGIESINFGGSEIVGLHNYKTKIAPKAEQSFSTYRKLYDLQCDI